MLKTSRQKILEYLEHRGPVGAAEIAHTLSVTPANVRHHLNTLQKEGVVVVAGNLPVHGRGRPTLLYTSTARARSHNLDALASALLDRYIQELPDEEQAQAVRALAGSMLPGASPSSSDNLTRRLTATVVWLNNQGYQARWEAHARSPQLILGHCPYASIIGRHPELCLLDAALLQGLLKIKVNQVKKLQPDANGLPHCLFHAG